MRNSFNGHTRQSTRPTAAVVSPYCPSFLYAVLSSAKREVWAVLDCPDF